MKLFQRVNKMLEHYGHSQTALGEKLGIRQATFNYYFSEKTEHNFFKYFPKILESYPEINRKWLYFGEGEMLKSAKETEPPIVHSTPPIPLTGLAECGIAGWYNRATSKTFATPPETGIDWIAVLAVGASLVPDGIFEGQLLFCERGKPVAIGEACYIERADGLASIKIYKGLTPDSWTKIGGWLPSNEAGEQKPYEEKLAPGQVSVIAPVIYVRRRL